MVIALEQSWEISRRIHWLGTSYSWTWHTLCLTLVTWSLHELTRDHLSLIDYCWWSLNINFDHQNCTKNGTKQHHSSDLYLQFTYFHLYFEIFAHAGKLYTYIKNQALKAFGARKGHHRPLGVVARPNQASANVAPSMLAHQSMWVAKKHTPKPSPPLISSQCKIKGRKEATHGLLDPPVMCWCSNWQMPSYPHSTTPLGAPHQRRRAHSSMGGHPTPRGIAWQSTSTKPTLLWTYPRRHSLEQRGVLV
jgi:hypothetical protein